MPLLLSLIALGLEPGPGRLAAGPGRPTSVALAQSEKLSGSASLPKEFVRQATAYLAERARLGRFSGAVRIDADGRTVLRRAWGYADWETKRPFTPETPGLLFSLTKSFTAAAALVLAERGRWTLDDEVGRWVPELPEAWRPVTLRQLLTHTSGISARDGAAWLTKHDGHAPSASDLADATPATPAGQRYAYSNLGYVLLGEAIAAASGRPYPEFVRETLLDPLGMRTAGAGGFLEGRKEVARGHTAFGGTLTPIDQSLGGIVAAGDLHASVDDLVRWRTAIDGPGLSAPGLSGPGLSGPGLFSEATRARLHEAPVDSGDGKRYGYGWTFDPEFPMWEHSGGGAGSQADLIWLPKRRVVIAVLANVDSASGFIPSTALALMASGLPAPRQKGWPLDALDRTQGVYRGAGGSGGVEATVIASGETLTLMRPGKADQTMEYAGGSKFQSSGTVAVFTPRPDGMRDVRLHTGRGPDATLVRVAGPVSLEPFAGVYGTGDAALTFARKGRWLAMLVPFGEAAQTLPVALLPAGGERFRMPRQGLEFRFVRDRAGRVSGVEAWRAGKRVLAAVRSQG